MRLAESLVQAGIQHNSSKNALDTMHSYKYNFNNDILYIDLCKEVVIVKWNSFSTTIDLNDYIGNNKKEYIELENKVEELIKNFISQRR